MSLIAGRGCRWPPRRDSVSPCAPLSGGRDTHDGHENSPILVFFSNLLERTLNRAWSAAADGVATEALQCIEDAASSATEVEHRLG